MTIRTEKTPHMTLPFTPDDFIAPQPSKAVSSIEEYAPFPNYSIFKLMKWHHNASTTKSLTQLDDLAHNVLLDPRFKLEELRNFRAAKEASRKIRRLILALHLKME